MKNLFVLCLGVLLCTSMVAAYGRYRGVGDHGYHRHGGGRRGGYVKTHSKHKSSFNMAHSHEHGEETFRRLKRAMFPNE